MTRGADDTAARDAHMTPGEVPREQMVDRPGNLLCNWPLRSVRVKRPGARIPA